MSLEVAVAPMMAYTDRYFRYLLRCLSQHIVLYTEMVNANAIRYGNIEKFLACDAIENPVVLQLGGSDPKSLSIAVEKAQAFPYSAINLNVGCPSERVQAGRFGACLMKEPQLVSVCVSAMQAVTERPVTVKTRIGVDENDSYGFFRDFVVCVAENSPCKTFIIHARKAWLTGLSPKENRTIPPLQYEKVLRLKQELPHLRIWINGGIRDFDQVTDKFHALDGVMIGRYACEDPYAVSQVDHLFYDAEHNPPERNRIVMQYLAYVDKFAGNDRWTVLRHLAHLYKGKPGARVWRQALQTAIQSQSLDPLLTVLQRDIAV